MAFDNDEQQSEHFKNFYNSHKIIIFSALIVFLLFPAGTVEQCV